ncbi:xylan glycosyltransferase MUCI21-like [Gastrolobium bilobum]|uniref:xylan glycosyltransferase MUCI21-like n=1 Tax=Gastrolobium bilobum TaxID=150636 RepID=UPI002AB20246|nr:xylan glycosyltransferase MUCI21-like [Gastrolobium bilobum]
MVESKTSRLSKSAVCFAVLLFIFFLQIIAIRDATTWKVKLSHILSLSEWYQSAIITCDRSHKDFDICTVNSPTLLDHASSTLFTLGPHSRAQPNNPVKIHPYPLKNDKTAMSYVKEITITSSPPKQTCGVTHHSPALVFSAGGYTGNFFHEINENFIPLFITINSLFPNQDVVLVITGGMIWWFQKYAELLSAFSHGHLIINTKNLTTNHCFSSATIGLIKHGPMIIDPKLLPFPKTLFDFHTFLKNAYTKDGTPLLYPNKWGRPNLTLVSRRGNVSRVILNQDEVIKVAEEVGFNVHVLEPSKNSSMVKAYRLIHTSHVMLGVHGAGLTHFLFLRPGSVLVQVVPIGTDWPSRTYYKDPTKILGLEYIEYKIQANESSLSESYGANSLAIKDPKAFHEEKWAKKRIYLKKQNVKLDITRFRKCLTKAYKKAKIFMDRIS